MLTRLVRSGRVRTPAWLQLAHPGRPLLLHQLGHDGLHGLGGLRKRDTFDHSAAAVAAAVAVSAAAAAAGTGAYGYLQLVVEVGLLLAEDCGSCVRERQLAGMSGTREPEKHVYATDAEKWNYGALGTYG